MRRRSLYLPAIAVVLILVLAALARQEPKAPSAARPNFFVTPTPTALNSNPSVTGTSGYLSATGTYDTAVSRGAGGSWRLNTLQGVQGPFVAVTPGKVYTLSTFLRSDVWPPGHVALLVRSVNASGAPRAVASSDAAGNIFSTAQFASVGQAGVWEESNTTFVSSAGDGITHIALYILRDSHPYDIQWTDAPLWADDFTIAEGIQPQAVGAECSQAPFIGAKIRIDECGNWFIPRASIPWTRSSTTATFTTAAHGVKGGSLVQISASSSTAAVPDATHVVGSAPSSSTFTLTVPNAGATSGTATVWVPWFPKCAMMDATKDQTFFNLVGAQGIDCNMWAYLTAADTSLLTKAKTAGMRTFMNVSQYYLSGGDFYKALSHLGSTIQAIETSSAYDTFSGFYWDIEWPYPCNEYNYWGLLRPACSGQESYDLFKGTHDQIVANDGVGGVRAHPSVGLIWQQSTRTNSFRSASGSTRFLDVAMGYVGGALTGGNVMPGKLALIRKAQNMAPSHSWCQLNGLSSTLPVDVVACIAHGGRGFSIFRDGTAPPGQQTAANPNPINTHPYWSQLPALRDELAAMQPIIQRPEASSATWQIVPTTNSWNNESYPVTMSTRDVVGTGYMILANITTTSQAIGFRNDLSPYPIDKVMDHRCEQTAGLGHASCVLATPAGGTTWSVTVPARGVSSGSMWIRLAPSGVPPTTTTTTSTTSTTTTTIPATTTTVVPGGGVTYDDSDDSAWSWSVRDVDTAPGSESTRWVRYGVGLGSGAHLTADYDAPTYTNHATSKTGAQAVLTFSGTSFAIYGAKGPTYGQFSVNIDGTPTATVDAYDANVGRQQLLYMSDTLPQGLHTVTLTVLGTKQASSTGFSVVIDKAVVFGVPPATTTTTSTTTTTTTIAPVCPLNGSYATTSAASALADGNDATLWSAPTRNQTAVVLDAGQERNFRELAILFAGGRGPASFLVDTSSNSATGPWTRRASYSGYRTNGADRCFRSRIRGTGRYVRIIFVRPERTNTAQTVGVYSVRLG